MTSNVREHGQPTPGAHWGPLLDLDGSAWPALTEGGVSAWLFDLDADTHAGDGFDVLSGEEQLRADRFLQHRDRSRFVSAHVMLRRLLSRQTGDEPQHLVLTASADGKPALADCGMAARCAFNLSHSGRWGLVGLSRAGAIGVDIEMCRPLPDACAIARAHFSTAEQAALFSLPEGKRREAFYACWTRKEAYTKAIGTGLATPLNRFEVAFAPGEAAALRSIDGSPTRAQRWTLADLDSRGGSCAAVAVRAPDVVVKRFRCA